MKLNPFFLAMRGIAFLGYFFIGLAIVLGGHGIANALAWWGPAAISWAIAEGIIWYNCGNTFMISD